MTLTIGIDVGGTHTDAVLISENKVHKKIKIPTNHNDLLSSTLEAIKKIYDPETCKELKRICISTTLSTNLIVENKFEKVGLLIIPGPGVSSKDLPLYEYAKVIDGYIDHRGKVIKEIDREEVTKALNEFIMEGIEYISVVSKFSNRNPELEKEVENIIFDDFPGVKFVSLGHRVAGRLNFPRRISTSFFNAAIYKKHQQFIDAAKKSLQELNINAPVFILKGDGGTLSLEDSKDHCVHTILSGPAASIMGMLSLTKEYHPSAFLMDLGGTSTDIGMIINGAPVFKPWGADISGYKTRVRALYCESIGIGGDSAITVKNKAIKAGPNREGPPLAYGGRVLTPTDAALYLNENSKEAAALNSENWNKIKKALTSTAEKLNLTPEKTAKKIVEECAKKIGDKMKDMEKKISCQPVYTVEEVLDPFILKVNMLIGAGGPTNLLIPYIAAYMDVEYILTPHYDVANAIGAGVARPTTVVTVHCDTASNYYVIPELGIKEKADKLKSIDNIIEIAQNAIKQRAKTREGYEDVDFYNETEITYQEEFNIVRDFNTIGKIYEVGAQVKPGPVFHLKTVL